jgi:transposase
VEQFLRDIPAGVEKEPGTGPWFGCRFSDTTFRIFEAFPDTAARNAISAYATQEQLRDALSACTELNSVYRRLVKMMLEELQFLGQQIIQVDQESANLLSQHTDAVHRLAEVLGLGVDSAQQIMAEVGATAATPPSEKHFSSWVGACSGNEESAEVSTSHRSRKAIATCGVFSINVPTPRSRSKEAFSRSCIRRLVPRLGHKQTIAAIAHRHYRLIWIILHRGVRYEERGPAVRERSRQARTARMIRQFRNLGYRVEPLTAQVCDPA